MQEAITITLPLPPKQMLLAIDPGFTESAIVTYDGERPLLHSKWANASLLRELHVGSAFEGVTDVVIEWVSHYGTGMAVGNEVFETCMWIGRFIEAWWQRHGGDKFGLSFPQLVKRATVKTHICGKAAANDSNIRQALIDRWGGNSVAIGGKKCKQCKGTGNMGTKRQPFQCTCHGGLQTPAGPLKEIRADEWQALGLAVCYYETNMLKYRDAGTPIPASLNTPSCKEPAHV